MAETRIGDAIDAIVAALRVDAPTAALAAVVDGPIVSGDEPETRIYVGYDGDNEGDYNATENWQQTSVGVSLGQQVFAESFDVVCAVWSWSGDMDAKTRRDKALAALKAAKTALRLPLNNSLGLPSPSEATWSQGQLLQEPIEDEANPGVVLGLRARIPFNIHVETRV